MSQRFDALQRSHAELFEVDLTALSGATELMESAKSDIQFGLDGAPVRATAKESRVATADSPTDKLPDIFRQIESVRVPSPAHPRLACLADRASLGAEAFRMLKVRLQRLRHTRSLKTLLITSTIPQEGKSTVAANLACALAPKTEQRILLLEGDLRCPSLSQTFGIEKRPGICEHLQDERQILKCIYFLEGAGIWFLPAGSATDNPLEHLQSGRVTSMMDQLSAWFDWIIIDSPPLLPLADTSVWMQVADGTLLVVRLGTAKRSQLLSGLEALEPKKVIGALLNGSRSPVYGDYYHYYYKPESVSRLHNTQAK